MNFQAAFNGVFGEAVTIFAVAIEGKLVIAKKTAFNPKKINENTLLIVNSALIDADCYFKTDYFQAALKAYYYLISNQLCVIQSDIAQFKPDNVIDADGQKDNGEEKYNISSLKNGHFAVLALCWYFYQQLDNERKIEKINRAINAISNIQKQRDLFITI